MELLLPFHIDPSFHKISYKEKIVCIGSCFSEKVGKKMQSLKFDVLQNPNGIVYDPESICKALHSYINDKKYVISDLFLQNELWHSWQHHSAFSGLQKEVVLQNINHSQANARLHLKEASWLVITPGTAYNYLLKETNKSVANCHKAPSLLFEKQLLPLSKIIADLSLIIEQLRAFNQGLKIIFTVSPVKHIKDGLAENNRSKARLIEAVHTLTEKFTYVHYFPAYELVTDVLRDYRFYKNDLVHPSDDAIEYIFDKFCEAFIDKPSRVLLQDIKSIHAAMHHKPFHKEAVSHRKFQEAQTQKINALASQHPYLNFSLEKNYFS